jgi:hypothetical protein
MNKSPLVLCVSYIPLFIADPTKNHSMKEIIKLLNEAIENVPCPIACVWAQINDKHIPCFLINKAREIVDHILLWSEDKPHEWFKLIVERDVAHYEVALFPNLIKSKERQLIQYVMTNNEIIPESSERQILFKPLHFRSKSISMINTINLADPSMVGFIESDGLDLNQLDLGKIPEPIMIGPFEIDKDQSLKTYSKGLEDE